MHNNILAGIVLVRHIVGLPVHNTKAHQLKLVVTSIISLLNLQIEGCNLTWQILRNLVTRKEAWVAIDGDNQHILARSNALWHNNSAERIAILNWDNAIQRHIARRGNLTRSEVDSRLADGVRHQNLLLHRSKLRLIGPAVALNKAHTNR